MSGKTYYMNMINLSGLYSKTPIKCFRKDSFELYWDESGDNYVDSKEIGLKNKDGHIMFSSENENDVILWTQGVMSTMKMLKKWSS